MRSARIHSVTLTIVWRASPLFVHITMVVCRSWMYVTRTPSLCALLVVLENLPMRCVQSVRNTMWFWFHMRLVMAFVRRGIALQKSRSYNVSLLARKHSHAMSSRSVQSATGIISRRCFTSPLIRQSGRRLLRKARAASLRRMPCVKMCR